jgi:DNA-binding transcriptional ArsR family regulator
MTNADPTRRAIIALIALQAMTPNALAENFDSSRQAISKHLRILAECELVKQEQQGREIYYSLEVSWRTKILRYGRPGRSGALVNSTIYFHYSKKQF